MVPALERGKELATGLWSKSSLPQKILIFGIMISAVIAIVMLFYTMNRTEYRLLYTKLSQEDAGRVVESLKAMKEPFKLEDDGKTILVSENKVYELRLKIAGEGILQGQGIGFEIFDQVKIGQTEFIQHINYQRALQGELARTIGQFPQVENARVHLVIPGKSLFIEEQKTPSASVILKFKQGQSLDSKQVQGIVNLVSSAVEGLKTDRVTVTDASGKILYQPQPTDSVEGMTTAKMDYKNSLEHSLQNRIEQLLVPIYGVGKVIAKVNTDVDFSQKTIRKESFDPEKTVIRSEQRSDEEISGKANLEAGVPEAAYQGGAQNAGGVSQQSSTRSSRTTNYEINKEEQNIQVPVGQLSRLSVAVIVDGTYEKEKDKTEYKFIPRSADELKRINDLVRNAVGVDDNRGDSIQVSSISFGGPDVEKQPTFFNTFVEYAHRLGGPLVNGLLILIFLVMVVRPVVLALIKPKVQAEEPMPVMEQLPEAVQRIALAEAEEVDESLAVAAMKRLQDFKEHAGQLADQNMDQAMTVIKNWLREEA